MHTSIDYLQANTESMSFDHILARDKSTDACGDGACGDGACGDGVCGDGVDLSGNREGDCDGEDRTNIGAREAFQWLWSLSHYLLTCNY